MSAKDRIRTFLEENVGKIVTTQEIHEVGKTSEDTRRIRELRDDEGMQIKTNNDRHDLKPGEYVLVSPERLPVTGKGISAQKRTEILERNGYTCRLCGAGAGDPDPFNPNRKLRLHVDHIVPKSQGGTDEDDNLRVLCSACNQGRGNIQAPSESALNLLARIRRTPRDVQAEVFKSLKLKFAPPD